MPIAQELVDEIIRLSQSDSESLHALSLVAKSWLPRSRRYAFEAGITINRKNASRFLELSPALPTCTMMAYVSTLIVTCDEKWDASVALKGIQLPKITSLIIDNLDFRATPGCPELNQTFPSVTALTLRPDMGMMGYDAESDADVMMKFKNKQQLYSFICSFKPLLHSLRIDSDIDFATYEARSSKLPLPPVLQKLHLSEPARAIKLLSWLTPRKNVPVLAHTVVFLGLYPDQYPHAGKYLRALGPALKDLKISFWYPRDEDELEEFEEFSPMEHFDLSHNTQLTHLHMHCRPDCGIDDLPIVSVKWASIFLSQITSTILEKVHIELTFSAFETLDLLQWPTFARVFDKMTSLESVHFEVWCAWNRGDDDARETRAEKIIREMLPGSVAREILTFEFCRM